MKVVLTQKQVSTQVIAESAGMAIVLLQDQPEFNGWTITKALATLNEVPNAYKQTMEFVELSGNYVIGSDLDPTEFEEGLKVWNVQGDAEWTVDFSKPEVKPAISEHFPDEKPNPYQKEGQPGWYFYDETDSEHGPFLSFAVAVAELAAYVDYLEKGPEEPASGSIPDPNDKPVEVPVEVKPTIPALSDLPG